MKKFTLLFGLALLWGGTNVVAQTTVSSYDGLKAAVDEAVSVATDVAKKQQTCDAALATFKSWFNRDSTEYKTVSIPQNVMYDKLYEFMDGNISNDEIEVYVGYVADRRNQTLVFAEKDVYNQFSQSLLDAYADVKWFKYDVDGTNKNVILTATNYKKAEKFLENEEVGKCKVARYYYFGVDGTVKSTTADIPTTAGNDMGFAYLDTWNGVKMTIPTTKKNEESTEIEAYTKAKDTYNTAYKAWSDANKTVEKTITLSENITDFSKSITELPANCTIDGAGYSIESSSALFEINKGVIKNLANPDGLITLDNEGTMRFCLEKADATTYRTYTTNTNYKDQQNVSLAEVIYGLTGFPFGLQVDNDTFIPGKKVYKAYYASAANKNLTTLYVNVNGNGVIAPKSQPEAATPVNTILYIDNDKLTPFGTNIAVKADNGAYTCAMVELIESEEFYIPMNVTAIILNYGRKFAAGYSSVCLPFALPLTQENGLKAYQFSNISTDNTTMWFSGVKTTAANTPYLINNPTEGAEIFKGLENVNLVATPAQLQTKKETGDFCGVYKTTYVSDLIQNAGYAVYGISKGQLVQAESDATKSDWLNPFRSYVYCKALSASPVTGSNAPSYQIGLLEDDDTETGIETVATDGAETIGVKGGENAVEVTTDKACKVNVYSMNGMLVMSENVEAGTTVLPVKAGMYVVNGVKVIVK